MNLRRMTQALVGVALLCTAMAHRAGGQAGGPARLLVPHDSYRNLAAPATIDARYLWETNDGEIIIVRNGGAFGSLVPTFEVRTDSPYAWLNTGLHLSSNPGIKPGGVGLTFRIASARAH